jgi:5,6-dimethylbenzimidazole synthase
MTESKHRYGDAERAAIYRVIAERRDMRHFLPDPIAPETFQRLLAAAHCAPSVGLMQPWRFILVADAGIRHRIHELVASERERTAHALGERAADFLRLKVEGILECGALLVAALCNGREKHVFGRRTLPETDLASVACAIQNLWLAARAEGLGMGWVSMFDPNAVARLLRMPHGAKPVGILCLGHVQEFYARPMLEEERWTSARPLEELVFINRWGQAGDRSTSNLRSADQ